MADTMRDSPEDIMDDTMDKKYDDNKVMHLVYKVNDAHDITHRFSPEGYELLNDEFVSYIDMLKPEIEKGPPLLLEITGCNFYDDEKERIENAVWRHYLLKLTAVGAIKRRYMIKIFWFLVCFIISSALLYLVNDGTIEIITAYAYIPFYFFGYRLVTYPILDYPPVAREYKWYARLAAVKLVFTEKPLKELPQEELEGIYEQTEEYYRIAGTDSYNRKYARDLLYEDGILSMTCCVENADDIIRQSSARGYEILSDEMASFLDQIEPFVKTEGNIRMDIEGPEFDEGEKASIDNAVRNFYQLRISETNNGLKQNVKKIIVFSLCLIIATAVLYWWGNDVDVAHHEFKMLLLWFFSDYLIEYVLLENRVLRYAKRKHEAIYRMPVNFIAQEQE